MFLNYVLWNVTKLGSYCITNTEKEMKMMGQLVLGKSEGTIEKKALMESIGN